MWNLMLYCEIVDYSWPFSRKIEEWLNFGNFPKMGLETSKHRSNIILGCWIRIWQRLLMIHIILAKNGWFIQKRLKSWKSDISLMVYSRLVLPLVLTRIGKCIYFFVYVFVYVSSWKECFNLHYRVPTETSHMISYVSSNRLTCTSASSVPQLL